MNAAGTGQLAGVCTSLVSGRGPPALLRAVPCPIRCTEEFAAGALGGEAESVSQAAVPAFQPQHLGLSPEPAPGRRR